MTLEVLGCSVQHRAVNIQVRDSSMILLFLTTSILPQKRLLEPIIDIHSQVRHSNFWGAPLGFRLQLGYFGSKTGGLTGLQKSRGHGRDIAHANPSQFPNTIFCVRNATNNAPGVGEIGPLARHL